MAANFSGSETRGRLGLADRILVAPYTTVETRKTTEILVVNKQKKKIACGGTDATKIDGTRMR